MSCILPNERKINKWEPNFEKIKGMFTCVKSLVSIGDVPIV
jgi:hypothetical protein